MLCVSCEEIISFNISNQTPEIITPSHNDTLQENPILIKWKKMEGATKYQLEIVSPSFNNIQKYILDTIVFKNTFSVNLDSNQFEFRLKAINSGYTSITSEPKRFWVGKNSGLMEKVELLTPLDSLYVNSSFIPIFNWKSYPGAISYEFSLRRGNAFSNGQIIYHSNNIATNLLFLNSSSINLNDGTYTWGIKAYGTSNETTYSTRKFFVDNVEPSVPILIAPSDNENLFINEVGLTWNLGQDNGIIQSERFSKLEIATDLNFTNLIFSEILSNSNFEITLQNGIYFWRVKSIDEANNSSNFSSVFKFTVQ